MTDINDLETGTVYCVCSMPVDVIATKVTPDIAMQLCDAVRKHCQYVKTMHHNGEHDDYACRLWDCVIVEETRRRLGVSRDFREVA